ncbi:hypothetical protein D3C84_432420 [compost metagenome]
MGDLVLEHLTRQLLTAVAPERQLLAILQTDRHRAFRARGQLFSGKQTIALDHSAARAVARLNENLTDDLTDGADLRSHVYFLRCQPLSAPWFERRTCLWLERVACRIVCRVPVT